jgi:hypothetical protein
MPGHMPVHMPTYLPLDKSSLSTAALRCEMSIAPRFLIGF